MQASPKLGSHRVCKIVAFGIFHYFETSTFKIWFVLEGKSVAGESGSKWKTSIHSFQNYLQCELMEENIVTTIYPLFIMLSLCLAACYRRARNPHASSTPGHLYPGCSGPQSLCFWFELKMRTLHSSHSAPSVHHQKAFTSRQHPCLPSQKTKIRRFQLLTWPDLVWAHIQPMHAVLKASSFLPVWWVVLLTKPWPPSSSQSFEKFRLF